jgi:hypothetical protein
LKSNFRYFEVCDTSLSNTVLLKHITLRINSGASWTFFCAVYFAKNRPACRVRFDALVRHVHSQP